jgi:hypothetical protein
MNKTNLASKVCSNCRHSRKKCDKILPQCTLCRTTNRTCVYPSSIDKSSVKNRSIRHQPYPISNTTNVAVKTLPPELNFLNDAAIKFKAALEIPFIPREEIDKVIVFMNNEMNNVQKVLPKPNEDVLAVVCALQAAVFKIMGKDEPAKYMYSKAKVLLATKFEDILENFCTAATYAYMAIYCGLNGEPERARYFLSNVQTFLQENNHPNAHFLRHIYHSGAQQLSGEVDLDGFVKEVVLHHSRLNEYYQHAENMDSSIVAIMDTSSAFKKIVPNDDIRSTNYNLTADRIVQLTNVLSGLYDRLQWSGVTSSFISAKRTLMLVLMNGLKLETCLKEGRIADAKDTADTISRMTSTPYYSATIPSAAVIISLAANVHLFSMRKTRDFVKQTETVERVRDDLVTLNLMCTRNRSLEPRCSDVMLQLAESLRQFEEGVMVYRTSAYLSSFNADLLPLIEDITIEINDKQTSEILVPQNETFSLDEVITFDDIDNFFNVED